MTPEISEPSFICPACGGASFGRDTGESRGKIVVLSTVRCHTPGCGWHGDWPRKAGRPPIAGETATHHVHIRTNARRKSAWVRATRPKSLAQWATEILDDASRDASK